MQNAKDELKYWVWLSVCLGPCAVNTDEILDTFAFARAVYENKMQINLHKLLTPSQIKRAKEFTLQKAQQIIESHENLGIKMASINMQEYPLLLVEMPNPPVVIYYKGNIGCMEDKLTIGVIGARKPSAYGIEATKLISCQLAKAGVVLISGLADGLDSEAHKASVNANVPTVAVLGNALDTYYPARNKQLQQIIEKQGLVLSEYPVGTRVEKSFFLQRNRIIAGLSRGLCVAEARRHSGTMSTLNFAAAFGRDIFAVPGSIFSPLSEGTLQMLKDGAKPVTCANDILEAYGLKAEDKDENKKPQKEKEIAGEEKLVYDVLSAQPIGIMEICSKTMLKPPSVMAILTQLEISGSVKQHAGRMFSKNI